jgi:hypothetical protein
MTEQELIKNETEPEEFESGAPARNAEDHLPTKPGWKVILSGIGFAAFSLLLLAVVITSLLQPGVITGFGWFIIVVFVIGAFASIYSAVDELRKLKPALALDKETRIETVPILDNWADNYLDGGIMNRKEVYHISYVYADGKEYAKHSIKKSLAPVLKAGLKIRVQYLQEDPKTYRPLFSE